MSGTSCKVLGPFCLAGRFLFTVFTLCELVVSGFMVLFAKAGVKWQSHKIAVKCMFAGSERACTVTRTIKELNLACSQSENIPVE
jgi:hypothetical protein